MATQAVGPSHTNYENLNAALSTIGASPAEDWTLQMDNFDDFATDREANVSGDWSTHTLIVEAGYSLTTPRLANIGGTNGRIGAGSFRSAIEISGANSDKCKFRDLELYNGNTSSNECVLISSASTTLALEFERVIFHYAKSSKQLRQQSASADGSLLVRNCCFFSDGVATADDGIDIQGVPTTIENCTLYGWGSQGFRFAIRGLTDTIIKNTILDDAGNGFGDDDIANSDTTNSDFLVTTGSGEGYTNERTSTTSSYENASIGDLRITSSFTDALDFAEDLSGSFTNDIDGNSRPGADWDCGCFQLTTGSAFKQITATIAGVGAATATLARILKVAGNLAASGDVAASVARILKVSGTVAGSGDVAASLGRIKKISGTVAGSGDIAAAVARIKKISATVAGAGGAAATLIAAGVASISATIAGSGNVASVVNRIAAISPVLAASGVVAAAVVRIRRITATIAATGAVSAVLGVAGSFALISATIASTGSAAATLKRLRSFSGTVAGSGSFASVLDAIKSVIATVAGSGSLSGPLNRVASIQAVMASVGAVQAVLQQPGAFKLSLFVFTAPARNRVFNAPTRNRVFNAPVRR